MKNSGKLFIPGYSEVHEAESFLTIPPKYHNIDSKLLRKMHSHAKFSYIIIFCLYIISSIHRRSFTLPLASNVKLLSIIVAIFRDLRNFGWEKMQLFINFSEFAE